MTPRTKARKQAARNDWGAKQAPRGRKPRKARVAPTSSSAPQARESRRQTRARAMKTLICISPRTGSAVGCASSYGEGNGS
jgi:hypothetical protein